MDTFEPPRYLASLIAAINDAAKAAQTSAVALVLLGLYLLGSALSASDEDMLLRHTLAIAQLGAQIPVRVSFAVLPFLFVALHVFTLTRYDMLATNVRQFRRDLETMVRRASDRERCRQLLANVEFIQSLTAPPGSPLSSWLFRVVAWVVIAGFPILVLLTVQLSALRYQSDIMSRLQRSSLVVGFGVLFWFQNRERWAANPNSKALPRWLMCLRLPALVVMVNIAWMNVLGSWEDRTFGSATKVLGPYFNEPLDHIICPKLTWGCRFLTVDLAHAGRQSVG